MYQDMSIPDPEGKRNQWLSGRCRYCDGDALSEPSDVGNRRGRGGMRLGGIGRKREEEDPAILGHRHRLMLVRGGLARDSAGDGGQQR